MNSSTDEHAETRNANAQQLVEDGTSCHSTCANTGERGEKSRAEQMHHPSLKLNAEHEEAQRIQLFATFEAAFLAADIERIADCIAPIFQWRQPNGSVFTGKQAALEEMAVRFSLPEGPRFSESRWQFESNCVLQRYRVEFKGADGQWCSASGFDYYETHAGLITVKDAYWKILP